MDENQNPLPFEESFDKQPPEGAYFPTGKRETRLGIVLAVAAVLLADFIIYGGFQLGFAVLAAVSIVATAVYLLRSGCKLTVYSGALLGFSVVIGGSFARSDDGFVKFVMLCFLLLSSNLGLCLLAGQNRRSPGGVLSLLDAARAQFVLGVGRLGRAIRGMAIARRQVGSAGKKRGAVLLGLAIAVPILAVLIFLLMRADAAFEGLLDLLPEMDLAEVYVSLILGVPLAGMLYTRGVALKHSPRQEPAVRSGKTMNPVTVNTVLAAVCAVYAVYLLSQIAYFAGGFAGILPEEYTMAEYARRGFFEMAWLCAINLGLIALAMALSGEKAPMTTKLLCLFIGLVTLFFVVAASAKMLLYIDAYGLTRKRVLTEVIMVFLALTTVCVCIWLFVPKFAYMKAVMLIALLLGSVTAWADVDTVVAAYNVRAYQSGQLDSVDWTHLKSLSDGAIPYIAELAEDENALVAQEARSFLQSSSGYVTGIEDFRSYNIATAIAHEISKQYRP